MAKQPDHAEKSKQIRDECENDIALKEARAELFSGLVESAKLLKNKRFSDDEKVALESIMSHLAIAGIAPIKNLNLNAKIKGDVVCYLPEQDGGDRD